MDERVIKELRQIGSRIWNFTWFFWVAGFWFTSGYLHISCSTWWGKIVWEVIVLMFWPYLLGSKLGGAEGLIP